MAGPQSDRKRKRGVPDRIDLPEPLPFLATYKPDTERLIPETAWLAYDPIAKVTWPDLSAYGIELRLVVMPYGRVVDVIREVDGGLADRQSGERLLQYADGLRKLGFERHPVGPWIRPHRPVYTDHFLKRFPKTTVQIRTMEDIVYAASGQVKNEMPDEEVESAAPKP